MGGSKDEDEEAAYDEEEADEEDDEAEGDGDWGAALRGAPGDKQNKRLAAWREVTGGAALPVQHVMRIDLWMQGVHKNQTQKA